MLFHQVKVSLQLLIDKGAILENKKIKMVDCEGKQWSFEEEDNRTLRIVSTEDGLNLIEVTDVTIHRWDDDMILGVINKDKEIILFFLDRGDEFSRE